MEYDEINNMLDGLEIKETQSDKQIETEKKIEVIEEKNKMNNFICFRDINHKKNIDNNSKEDDIDINKQINNRMFDLNNNYKTRPIMEFYPQSSRTAKKKTSN